MFDLQGALLLVPGFLIGFAFHEFAHAFAADKLGDPTPRMQGRLTIEPWPHIDIFGFITLLLVGFGWAKPVQIDPRNFKNPKRDDIIVSLAGPLTNLALAIMFGIIVFVLRQYNIMGSIGDKPGYYLEEMLGKAIWINVLLFIFNLLPIPPLDGSHVVANLLPYHWAIKYMSFQVYSLLVLATLIITKAYVYIVMLPSLMVFTSILDVFRLGDLIRVIM
ncbi:MAG TPA: site-2 protease family protein [Clostridiales bacterium]|nr:site-2 protease family protein [Clostridiales bacterium]